MPIQLAIKQLCKIISRLQKNHKFKKFTLDGRLVGDLGEVLAEVNYKIVLFDKIEKQYDALTFDKKKVQIKATFKDKITFPTEHVPELFLGLKIHEDGSFEEVYNGPGEYILKLICNRKSPYNRLHLISIKKLKEISESIPKKERIKKRIT